MARGDFILSAIMLGLDCYWLCLSADETNPKDAFTRIGAGVLGLMFAGIGLALLLPAGSL